MRNAPLIVALCAVALGLAGWYFLSDSTAPPTRTDGLSRTVVEAGESDSARSLADGGAGIKPHTGGGGRDVIDVAAEQQASAPEQAQSTSTGPALRGRVVASNGAPIANALVVVAASDFMPIDYLGSPNRLFGKRWNTRSRADGTFEVRGLEPGTLRIGAWADGFAPFSREGINMPSGEGTTVDDLVLDRGVRLSGFVTVMGGGPVAGAQLFVESLALNGFMVALPGQSRRPLAVTDERGAFDIQTLAAGPWKLKVKSSECPDQTFEGKTSAPGAHEAGLNFELPAGATIAGHVADLPDPRPTGLRVVARPERGNGWGPVGDTRRADLAADGSFQITGCLADKRYDVHLIEEFEENEGPFGAGSPTRSNTQNVEGGTSGVLLTYMESNGLTFLVQDANGQPIEDLRVTFGREYMTPYSVAGQPVESFPGGRVLIADIPRFVREQTGAFKVSVYAGGYAPLKREVQGIGEGGIVDLGVLVLEEVPTVTVRVTDMRTGEPIEGADVVLSKVSEVEPEFMGLGDIAFDVGQEEARRAKTGADGRAVLSSYEGAVGSVRATHPDFTRGLLESVSMPVGRKVELDLPLLVGGRVVVRAMDALGEPMPGMRIETRRPPEPQVDGEQAVMFRAASVVSGAGVGDRGVTDEKGVAVFEHLEPGAHQFRIGGSMASSNMMVSFWGGLGEAEADWTELSVGEGETRELELIDTPKARVTGVVREGGRPLAGARVRLEEPRDQVEGLSYFNLDGGGGTTTDGNGRFVIERVEPGSFDLVVEHTTRVMEHSESLVVVQGENTVSVDLPIAIVEGRVTDKDGNPVAGAKVRIEKDGQPSNAFIVSMLMGDAGESSITVGGDAADPSLTNMNGEYSLRGVLTDVPLRVKVDHQGNAPVQSEEFEVGPGQVKRGVDLQLLAAGKLHVTLQGGPDESYFLARAKYLDAEGVEQVTDTLWGTEQTLEGLRPGRWMVTLLEMSGSGPGSQRDDWKQEVEIQAGATGEVAFTY